MFRCVCVIEGSKNQNRWPHLGNLSIMFLDLLWNYIVLMFAFADPLFSLSILVFPATHTHARALILMDITMICPILYSVRFVSTVIISKRFWRRIIFYDFSLYSVSLRKWWSSRETSACILWHCVYVIKQYKKYLDWMVSCLSVCFIFFITNSIFYTFANCFKRPINNMCNLWLFLESIQMIETSSLSLGSLFCYGNRLRFHCVVAVHSYKVKLGGKFTVLAYRKKRNKYEN